MPVSDTTGFIRDYGHTALIAATIEQAWYDAQRSVVPDGAKSTSSTVTEAERREARLFLLAKTGPWAESREHLCACVGIDAEVLRLKARAVLG